MNAHREDRIKQLLQAALPPARSGAEPGRDLWPAVLRRLDVRDAPTRAASASPLSLPWFDWALIAGLIVFAAFFPATIPVILYYL